MIPGNGIRLGRLFGITIRVDWSWLIIAFLITWNLTNIFGQVHPTWGAGLRWGLALVASLLFFASVLAHELAHALVARAQNLPVRNITLFLFGGVANIQREPESPKNEFLLAGAGPLMSFALGALMLLVVVLGVVASGGVDAPGRLMAALSPASTLLLWLGSINIILALFNLIPGFPLDGGRVLRSMLWALTGSLRRATRMANAIGKLIAMLMIALGLAMAFGFRVPVLGTGLINGIWLAFIGFFLNNAANQSQQQVALQDMLQGVSVGQLMHRSPTTVEAQTTVAHLLSLYRPLRAQIPGGIPVTGRSTEGQPALHGEDHAFPVLENGRLVGIITLDDARRAPRARWETTPVRDLMTPSPRLVTVRPDEDVTAAMEKLIQRDLRQLPVVEESETGDTRFLGLLRRGDIVQWLHRRYAEQPRRRGLLS